MLLMASITSAVIMVIAISDIPKLAEYITPEKVFLYMKKMKSPSAKASARARLISTTLTAFTLSMKLDEKIS